RLSVIDLDSGHQPMFNEDESVCVLFNGEIYNFRELRSVLEAKGHRFRSQSDTETIVHLYEESGEQCFAELHGMFAIAIWDRKRRRLLLGRDPLGKKPLFYSWQSNRLTFGSEIKAILASRELKCSVDMTAVCDYFAVSYIPAPKT